MTTRSPEIAPPQPVTSLKCTICDSPAAGVYYKVVYCKLLLFSNIIWMINLRFERATGAARSSVEWSTGDSAMTYVATATTGRLMSAEVFRYFFEIIRIYFFKRKQTAKSADTRCACARGCGRGVRFLSYIILRIANWEKKFPDLREAYDVFFPFPLAVRQNGRVFGLKMLLVVRFHRAATRSYQLNAARQSCFRPILHTKTCGAKPIHLSNP